MGLADKLLIEGKLIGWLSREGRIFTAGDNDFNDTVTGQTSGAATTPTWLIDVPTDTTCVPLVWAASQAGTVAGGDITVSVVSDNIDRYASGGTAERVRPKNTRSSRTALCTVYSGPTAEAASGNERNHMHITLGPDVSPAEGAVQEPLWTPTGSPLILYGPAAFLIYTYAGTTGPTWGWTIDFGEYPSNWHD